MEPCAHPYNAFVRVRRGERTGAAGEFNAMGTTTGPRSRTARRNASAMRMVGALLAVFRTAAGYTQQQLGDLLGLGEQTVASIEQGRRRLMPDVAARLDELLDTKG